MAAFVGEGGAGADPAGVTFSVLGQPTLTANTLASRCTDPNAHFTQRDNGGGDLVDGPTGIAIASNGRIFVVDDGGQRIMSWPNADALTSCQAADKIIGAGWPEGPEAIAVGPDNTIYLGDTRGQVVDVWTPDANGNYSHDPQAMIGAPYETGNDSGHFFYPRGVAVDDAGRLFVADDYNDRIEIFNPPFTTGMSATDSIHAGNNGGLNHPKALAFANGNLYVADFYNERVLRFPGPFDNPATSYTANATFTGLQNPVDLSVSPTGALLVTGDDPDTGTPEVGVYPNAAAATGTVAAPSSVLTFNHMTSPGPDNPAGEPLGIVQDGAGRLFWADYGGFRVVIENPPAGGLTVNSTAVHDVYIQKSYGTVALKATGGTGTLVWSISGGALPPGLKMSTAGAITGTPTTAGTYNFSVAVHDASKPPKNGAANLSITVYPMDIDFSVTSLDELAVGVTTWKAKFTASGGKPTVTFHVTGGSIPPGMTLSTAGALGGTPTAWGTYGFQVTATDTATPKNTAPMNVSLYVSPMHFQTTPLASGYVYGKFSYKPTLIGGRATLHWSATGLPPGLTISASSGLISGTPTTVGVSHPTVTVVDSNKPVETASLAMTITINPMSVATTSLPDGTAKKYYTSKVTANGGKPTLVWSLIGGALPTGIKLSAAGALAGTPTIAGTYTFTVQVTDKESPAAVASKTLSITIH